MSSQRIVSQIIDLLVGLLAPKRASSKGTGHSRPRATLRPQSASRSTPTRSPDAGEQEPGRFAGSETIRITGAHVRDVRIGYAPDRDGAPDAGEIVWTWVPYEENDGRGKDRPVLVIGRQSADRVYAVRMTSKAHERDRDYLAIGSGAWDSQGRESWVDIEQLYSVHERGLRREAAVLDAKRYARVAQALAHRYGWKLAK